jgi:lysylphosphatidylglycerol synthase-like protein
VTALNADDPQQPGRLQRLHSATRRAPSPRAQRAILVVAAVGFIVGGWFALKSLDVSLAEVRWPPLLIAALVGVPLTLVANTFEYLLSGRMLHHRIQLLPALQLTTISTAANLLPIPGAFLVRIQGLRALGSGTGKALASTMVIALVWIGISSLLAGILLAFSESWIASVTLAAVGVITVIGAYVWLVRAVPERGERRRIAMLAVAIELFAVVTNAARLVLILIGLRVDASLGQALVLAVSSSLAAAAGIFPGGLGLRELIAALLAPLVGLPASAGFAATAINRVMGIIVLAPITAVLALRSPQGSQRGQPPPETDEAGADR